MNKYFKKIIPALIIFFLSFIITASFWMADAQIPENESSSSAQSEGTNEEVIDKLKKIEVLKEKIATKVAEIRENEKSALFGQVKEKSDESIILLTKDGEKKFYISEDSVFYDLTAKSKEEIEKENIELENIISVFGYIEPGKDDLLAKFVFKQEEILHLSGKIVDKDKSNYTITINDKKGNILVDIEKYTDAYQYDKENESLKSIGFSKLEIGNIVHVIGINNEKENNRIHAQKIYIIPYEETVSPTPSASVSITESPKNTDN